MVIGDLDALRVPLRPHEANTPFVAHSNRVLPLAVVLKGFETETRTLKVMQRSRIVEHGEFAQRHALEWLESLYELAVERCLRIAIEKAPNHLQDILYQGYYVKGTMSRVLCQGYSSGVPLTGRFR